MELEVDDGKLRYRVKSRQGRNALRICKRSNNVLLQEMSKHFDEHHAAYIIFWIGSKGVPIATIELSDEEFAYLGSQIDQVRTLDTKEKKEE